MFRTFAVIVLAATLASFVPAQASAQGNIPELRPFAGGFLPTGIQRDQLRGAGVMGLQGALEMGDAFHLVATAAWSPTRFVAEPHRRLNIYMADAGLEMFSIMPWGESWEFRPFAGLGAGARSYDPLEKGISMKTRLAGYGCLGGELQLGRLAFRIETRDYMTRGEIGRDNSTVRNDLMLAGGGAYHW